MTMIKMTKDGRKVEVIGHSVCINGIAEASVIASIGNHPARRQILQALPTATHIAGRIALTSKEAECAQSALDAAKAAYEASAEGIEKKLRNERESLISQISAHLDDAQYYGTRAWESGNSVDGGYSIRKKHEDTANAAREALDEFDAKHPDLLAKIKAEQEARRQELIESAWNN